MNILLLNLILTTHEEGKIVRRDTNTGCLFHNIARGLVANGHTVTLVAAEDFRPLQEEHDLDFDIVYFKSLAPRIFQPWALPFPKGLIGYLRKNSDKYDLIISSEVFSIASLMAAITVSNTKLIIWQEMSLLQKMMRHIPAKVWYNVVLPIFMHNTPIIARSEAARKFIAKYSHNVDTRICDHGGADANIFHVDNNAVADDSFCIVSRLSPGKQIDRILRVFAQFIVKPAYSNYKLHIIGDGPEGDSLKSLCRQLKIDDNVIFHGFMNHTEFAAINRCSKGLLIYTLKDHNMVSISESVANGTPILTTSIPSTAQLIAQEQFGVVCDNWGVAELENMVENYAHYHRNCINSKYPFTVQGSTKLLVEICSDYIKTKK